MRKSSIVSILAPLLLSALLLHAQAPGAMGFAPAAASKFVNLPNLPACASIAVQDGDPSKGPSVILLRAKAGCRIPWHFHTATERLMIVSGSGRAEMKGMKSTALKPGDFLLLPGKGIHQFTAQTAVELFDLPDAAFDVHYVDADEKEIPLEAALKAARKPATKPAAH